MNAKSHVEGVGAIVLACDRRAPAVKAWPAGHEPAARVRQIVRAAVDAGLWPVVVVVGAGADLIRGALAGLPVVTCTGEADGPGGALHLGLARLTECAPAAQALVLLRCDGLPADAGQLGALAVAARREGRPIAASARGDALDVPAFFAAELFPELAASGGSDARALLSADASRVARVEMGASGDA